MDSVTMEQITEIRDLEYWNNATLCTSILKDWKNKRPDNKEISSMLKALGEMHFILQGLEMMLIRETNIFLKSKSKD